MTYFPILIQIISTREIMKINSPEGIPSSTGFIVLQTCVPH